MSSPRPPTATTARPFSWRRILLHGSITTMALGLGLMSWYISKPVTARLHETTAGQRLTIKATPDISISLDTDSAITVANSQPPWVELLRGNAYFDVTSNDTDKLEVRIGAVRIKDIGTRFSVRMQPDGGSVAVADGQVEIHMATGTYLVGARERADFDSTRVTEHRIIAEADVAPWRLAR
ncbi:MAG: FecR family protein [Nitrosospira sp.]|nr:FecR family protein [Nitrosospira sp.]